MNKRLIRGAAALLVIAVILGALLALDLLNRGLAWRVFWSLTGEEEPLAQVRGMVELGGNLVRPLPHNDPYLPVNHTGENPYGINTFLQKEVEVPKVDEQLRMIAAAGFGWVRQEFVWEDIEVDGRGQYTDSRNDVDGDGVIDTIDGWAKYDRIVELAEKHGIRIQARLSNPPAWAQAQGDPSGFGIPDDLQDYVNFAAAAATRYRGRITHYQIWNEPNIYPEWGALPDGSPRPIDPETYTELLCRTHDAIKAIDPDAVIISGALAPTSALTARDLNDFIFLQRMYDAGAAACFDVLSMQGYGLNSGPTDRRMRPTTVNVGRSQYIREIMVNNGDAHKPIWISEAAWNSVPSPSDNPNIIEPREMFGQVTLQQAADYIPQFYQRIQQEWPWVGVVNYWFFTLPDAARQNEPMYYFRMAEPDYSPERPTYTPLPVYYSMQDYITTQTPTLYRGVKQLDGHWAVSTDPAAQRIDDTGAQFRRALQAQEMRFTAYGTDVNLRWRGAAATLTVNGETRLLEAGGGWRSSPLASSLLPQTWEIRITSDTPADFDSVTISDRTAANLGPFVALGGGVLAAALIALGVAAWRRLTRA